MSDHDLSAIPHAARAFQGQTAGIVTRVLANTVDVLVVAVLLGAGYVGWASVVFILDPRSFAFPSPGVLFSLGAAIVVAIVYLWLSWWLLERSIGGRVLGLRVTGRHGRRLGPARVLARSVFCVLFPLGLMWCVLSSRRWSLQDTLLWTVVVYDWTPRVTAPPDLGPTPPTEPPTEPPA